MAYFLDKSLIMSGAEKGRSGYNRGSSFNSGSDSAKGGRTNQYAADCGRCGQRVPKGQGSLSRQNGAWVTKHLTESECAA